MLCKDGRGQDLGALLIGAKGRVHKYGVQQDIKWPQLVPLGASFCLTYIWVNPSSSREGHFHGRPRHRGDVTQFYVL